VKSYCLLVAHVQDRWFSRGPDGEQVPTARHGKGLRWRVRYLDPEGFERSQSFDRRIDALRFRSSTEAAIDRGTWTDPEVRKTVLADYAREWLEGLTGEPSTLNAHKVRVNCHIIPGLGNLRLGDIRPSRVQSFMANLRTADGKDAPLAPNTARGVFITLGAILSAAVDDEIIVSNPLRKKSVRGPRAIPRKVVPWSSDLVAAIRAGLPERWRVFADLGSGLGLRQGEALGLDVGLIEMLPHVVHVNQQLRIVEGCLVLAPPKYGIERDVPLPESVAQATAAHLAQFPAVEVSLPWRVPGGKPKRARLLLTREAGTAIRRDTFNHAWRRAIASAGLKVSRETGTHQLRHHYASVLLGSGDVNIRELAEYMGHKDPAVTLRTYIHLLPSAPDRARKAVDRALAAEHRTKAPAPRRQQRR
jgi:integrase